MVLFQEGLDLVTDDRITADVSQGGDPLVDYIHVSASSRDDPDDRFGCDLIGGAIERKRCRRILWRFVLHNLPSAYM